jgi:hypothetical protein
VSHRVWYTAAAAAAAAAAAGIHETELGVFSISRCCNKKSFSTVDFFIRCAYEIRRGQSCLNMPQVKNIERLVALPCHSHCGLAFPHNRQGEGNIIITTLAFRIV